MEVGEITIRLPPEGKLYIFFRRVLTGCGPYPVSYSMVTGAFSGAVKRFRCEADHSPHLALRLSMNGGILPRFQMRL